MFLLILRGKTLFVLKEKNAQNQHAKLIFWKWVKLLLYGLQAGAPEGASQYWFEHFSHKKLKSILKNISFLTLINALWWKDKRISDVTFYTEIYFTRMQRFFISDVFCLRKKKLILFQWFFVNVFSKAIDANHSTHMIS